MLAWTDHLLEILNKRVYITKIELMHLVGVIVKGYCQSAAPGYLEMRRLKLKHTWQLTGCLLQIINGSLPTGSTISITTVGAE